MLSCSFPPSSVTRAKLLCRTSADARPSAKGSPDTSHAGHRRHDNIMPTNDHRLGKHWPRTQGQLEVPFLLPLSLSSLTLAASARACSNCRGHFERAHTLRPAGHLPAQPLALRGGRLATASRAILMNAPCINYLRFFIREKQGAWGENDCAALVQDHRTRHWRPAARRDLVRRQLCGTYDRLITCTSQTAFHYERYGS